ncbi:MFS transporter [Peribacillus simplex]
MPAIVSFTIGMIILSQSTSGALLLVAAAFMGLGHGILVPAYQTIAMNAVSPERRGIAAATYFMLFDVGYGLGSYFLGVVSNSTGYRIMFMISAGIVLFSAIVFRFIISSKKNNETVSVH